MVEKNNADNSAEQALRIVLDGINEPFYSLDSNWRFLFASRSALQLWKKGNREILGHTFLEVFLQAVQSEAYKAHVRVMQSHKAEHLETISPVINRWIEIDLSPTPQGGISVSFRDIEVRMQTERRQAFLLRLSDVLRPLTNSAQMERTAMRVLAEELGADRAFLATINNDEQSWSIKHDYANGLPGLTGSYPMSRFQQSRLSQWQAGLMSSVSDSETNPDFSEADRAAYAAFGTRSAIAVPLVKGGRFAALLSVNMIMPHEWTDYEKALINETAERIWLSIERVRAEEALRVSEKGFESIANLVPDLLWDSEPDGSTNWYNQRWLEYTGQSFQEAIGYGWVNTIHPQDREASAKRYAEAAEQGKPLQQEHRIRRHDGEYRWFEVKASPLKDKNGKVIKLYGSATDIHDRKQNETRQRLLLNISDNLNVANSLLDIQTMVTNLLQKHYNSGWCYYVEWDEEKKNRRCTP